MEQLYSAEDEYFNGGEESFNGGNKFLEGRGSQSLFDTAISSMPAHSKIYTIHPQLGGTIDMDVFSREGRQPDKIIFSEGTINSLINIPKSLKELYIDNNALTRIPDGTESLLTLHANNNRIRGVCDFEHHHCLVELQLNGNEIADLVNLSPTLKRMSIQKNPGLIRLDLAGLTECEQIDCRKNSGLKHVVNVTMPKGMRLDVDPHTRVSYIDPESGLRGGGPKQVTRKEQEQEESEINTVDSYYALKHKYEQQRSKDVRSVMGLPSKKEKQAKLRTIPHKCVNCRKPGGTHFWRKSEVLYAECAATGQRCKLNLAIPVGFYSNIYYLLTVTDEDMTEKRNAIIRLKMDTLFGYITEAASTKQFKRELEMYQADEAMYNTYKEYEAALTADPVKTRLMAKKTDEIYKVLKEVRVMMEAYSKSGDTRMLKDAVEKQVNELYPEVKALRDLNYPIMNMVESDEGMRKLHQMHYDPKMADYKLMGAATSM